MLLRDILERKGPRVISVQPGTTILEAVRVMVENKVGAVLVVNEKNQPLGIFTERDNLRATLNEGIAPAVTTVDEFMTRDLVCGFPTASVEEAMAVMTEQRVRHLPVVAEGLLVGLVSIGDVVKATAEHREAEIHYLKNYISGTGY
ncbi:MAG TPA: CBS domain-containing protein [Bacteroidetes bacterium]|nr:CBS domain-containing protein [Bacteroidota bacterium]